MFGEDHLSPILFKSIRRKADRGFGEGAFSALFDRIALGTMCSAVLRAVR